MRQAGPHRLLLAAVLAAAPPVSAAEITELVGRPVVEVQLFVDGVPQRDETRFALIETRAAQPLSLREVRESITHLYALGDFFDVVVSGWMRDNGVVLRYDLVALDRRIGLEMRGDLGRPASELIDVVTRRFGRVVRTEELDDAVVLLEAEYRALGRFAARIEPAPLGAGRLRFDIDQGPPAQIASIELRGALEDGRSGVLERLGLVEGGVYDTVSLD